MTSTEIEVDDPQLSSYPMYRLPRGKKWHYVSRSMSKRRC